jgi:hypothetical protein
VEKGPEKGDGSQRRLVALPEQRKASDEF